MRLERIAQYGPGSEKLNSAQLELLELEPGVSLEEVEAESKRAAPPTAEAENAPKKHPGRQTLPSELPRVERIIPSAIEQCSCRTCGRETVVIGYEQSEQLDVKPAEYFVLVTKREKRVCRSCEEAGVITAPLPARVVDKSLVSDRVIINTVVAKYSDHQPLSAKRDSGARDRDRDQPSDDGWLDYAGR